MIRMNEMTNIIFMAELWFQFYVHSETELIKSQDEVK